MSGTSVREERSSATEGACPVCGGRGWTIKPDGGAGTAVRCDCAKRERTAAYLAQAGIPERYSRCRLSNFNSKNADPEIGRLLFEAKRTSQLYVDEFFDPRENRFRASGLIFIGPPGIGKTHLAVAVLNEIVERYQVRARFVDFTMLLHQIQSTFDPASSGSKHEILDPIVKAELLVLDELGAQKPTDWVMNTLYLIMNTRYTERRATIFTTNYRLDNGRDQAGEPFGSLSARISPMLVSRLYEMAQPVLLSGLDYRREVKLHSNRIGR